MSPASLDKTLQGVFKESDLEIDPVVKSNFLDFANQAYKQVGNLNYSLKATKDHMSSIYGVTKVNNSKRLMYAPPEKFLNKTN